MYIHTILFKYSAHLLCICNGATLRTRERVLRIALFRTVYMHSVDVYMHFNGGLHDLHICSIPLCIHMLSNRCIYTKRVSNIQKGRQEGHYIQKLLPEGHYIHRIAPHIQNPLFLSVYICGTIRIKRSTPARNGQNSSSSGARDAAPGRSAAPRARYRASSAR